MKYRERQPAEAEREAAALLESHGYQPLTARVLAARGIWTPDEADTLQNPTAARLHDPFLLDDMDKAVERIHTALEQSERIAVYGDYDADGLTATALMLHVLRDMGADVIYHIPNRLTEGYGLRAEALQALQERGVRLVVTVDTGVTAVEEIDQAKTNGLDFVVTDHHECRERLPDAAAVVNPRRPDSAYPFDGLAGVGVAFKLCCALCGDRDTLLARYGALVAIGTIADIMPVTDENRIFITYGLATLAKTRRPGLRALLRAISKADGELRSQDIGFHLAPRINAAGRLGRAELALQLLLTDDTAEAEKLAASLNELNARRKQIEEDILEEALACTDGTEAAIVPVGENWHQGVAGIVASSLVKRFGKPVFLVCLEGDEARGSARSVPGCNLVDILSGVSHLLTEYGGHEQAAGFSLCRQNITEMKAALNRRCAETEHEALPPDCEAPIRPGWINMESLRQLEALEPFGAGFPAPVFTLRDVYLSNASPIGQGKHSRLCFDSEEGKLHAVWFGQGPPSLCPNALFDIAFHASVNRFQGKESPQLQLLDMQPSEQSGEWEASLRLYRRFHKGDRLSPEESARLLPSRDDIVVVWRALAAVEGWRGPIGWLSALRRDKRPDNGEKVWMALDILRELGLCRIEQLGDGTFRLERLKSRVKMDLDTSALLQKLRSMAEGGDANAKTENG